MSVFYSLRQLVNIRATSQVQSSLLNFSPARNVRVETKVKWTRPVKVASYLPVKSGDQLGFEMPDPESLRKYFDTNEKLMKCSNKDVLKVFSMGNQSNRINFITYKEKLVDKVKAHKYDLKSEEVKIAKITADIRYNQFLLTVKPSNKRRRCIINELIHKRRNKLKNLRATDYRKFEWLLEKLDLIYKPDPIVSEEVHRKKSIKLLAELSREKLKEKKLAEYKKKLDDMKVPYLEKKLQKLLWIKKQESSLQLVSTVSDSDIEDCRKEIEKVKLEVEERHRKGYMRKVHPYTLEVYEAQQQGTT